MKNTYEFQTVLIIDKATIVIGLNLIIQFNFTPCQLYVLFWMKSFFIIEDIGFFPKVQIMLKKMYFILNLCTNVQKNEV
jgi:hypothetical protein